LHLGLIVAPSEHLFVRCSKERSPLNLRISSKPWSRNGNSLCPRAIEERGPCRTPCLVVLDQIVGYRRTG
jgi:hypothetical protein